MYQNANRRLTGCPELTAKYYCDLAGGSADQAVVLYFDSGGAPPPVVNKAPRFELPSGALPELTDKGLHEILKVCVARDLAMFIYPF